MPAERKKPEGECNTDVCRNEIEVYVQVTVPCVGNDRGTCDFTQAVIMGNGICRSCSTRVNIEQFKVIPDFVTFIANMLDEAQHYPDWNNAFITLLPSTSEHVILFKKLRLAQSQEEFEVIANDITVALSEETETPSAHKLH